MSSDAPLPRKAGVADPAARLERLSAAVRPWVTAVRGVPTVLTAVLWTSIFAGLGLAWLWFLSRDTVLLRWLSVPWLLLLAAPQFGLWLLTASIRDLLALPERLATLKSGITERVAARERVGAIELSEPPRKGFLRRLRAAASLHGELTKIVGTKAILGRLTGRFAVLIGPVSFVLNCIIIGVGLVHLFWLMR